MEMTQLIFLKLYYFDYIPSGNTEEKLVIYTLESGEDAKLT